MYVCILAWRHTRASSSSSSSSTHRVRARPLPHPTANIAYFSPIEKSHHAAADSLLSVAAAEAPHPEPEPRSVIAFIFLPFVFWSFQLLFVFVFSLSFSFIFFHSDGSSNVITVDNLIKKRRCNSDTDAAMAGKWFSQTFPLSFLSHTFLSTPRSFAFSLSLPCSLYLSIHPSISFTVRRRHRVFH